jgi:cytochrome c-type biogenesis protein CcmE
MHIKTLILILALTLSPLTAIAGGGHNHGHSHAVEINKSRAKSTATLRVGILVNKGKIDKSWKSAKVASTEKKMNGNQAEWVVTYKNSQVKDPAKGTLYIFLSTTGDYIAANFTGK